MEPAKVRPSTRDFTNVIPPFPDNVKTAPLLIISHQKLYDRDPEEVEKLWKACTTAGFFYYNLRADDSSGQAGQFLESADDLFDLMIDAFALPQAQKDECNMVENGCAMFGYKPVGAMHVDKHCNMDTMEHYFIGSRDILSQSPNTSYGAPFEGRKYPKILISAFPGPLTTFTNLGAQICNVLLSVLSSKLGIPSDNQEPPLLLRLHSQNNDTSTHVRMIRALPTASSPGSNRDIPLLMPHSDWGSITLLFNIIGGLQIYAPNGLDAIAPVAGWQYVRPIPGHAIVNIGDSLAVLSNGVLKSVIHRVVTPPGAQAGEERYSLAYFLRVNNSVMARPLEGAGIPIKADTSNGTAEQKEKNTTFLQWMLRRGLKRKVKNADELHEPAS